MYWCLVHITYRLHPCCGSTISFSGLITITKRPQIQKSPTPKPSRTDIYFFSSLNGTLSDLKKKFFSFRFFLLILFFLFILFLQSHFLLPSKIHPFIFLFQHSSSFNFFSHFNFLFFSKLFLLDLFLFVKSNVSPTTILLIFFFRNAVILTDISCK